MDRIPNHHAYRCLPLSIANSHGWEVLSPCAFSVEWTGGIHARDLKLSVLDGHPHLSHLAASHFAFGIVTFHLGYLFRTEPGWDLFASGPLNAVKDGIAPLSGIIETDWLPYPFTMNWQMTRPGTVRFDKDEPLCMVFPLVHGALPTVEFEIFNLDDDPELLIAVVVEATLSCVAGHLPRGSRQTVCLLDVEFPGGGAFVDLVRQCTDTSKDVPRLTGRSRKS
jgi:hypothetical protein